MRTHTRRARVCSRYVASGDAETAAEVAAETIAETAAECQPARCFVRVFRKNVRGRFSSRALRLCFIKGTYGQVARDTWHVNKNGLQLHVLSCILFYCTCGQNFKKK